MKFIPHQYRHMETGSLREHRLCFDTPETIRGTVESLTNWVANRGVDLGKILVSVPRGVISGIKDSWDQNAPSKEEAGAFLYKVGEFFKDVPVVGSFVEKYYNGLDAATKYEKLKQLVDRENWVSLLGNDAVRNVILNGNIDADTVKNADGDGQKTVLDFLSKLTPPERQSIFMEFVNKYIPEDVQKKNGVSPLAFAPGTTPGDKYRLVNQAGKVDAFGKALGAIFGTTDPLPNSSEEKIARESLEMLYDTNNPQTKKVLVEDYQNALRYNQLSGLGIVQNSPESMARNMPASRFRGALKLGVVGQPDLDDLGKNLNEFRTEQTVELNKVGEGLNKLKGETKQMVEKEARTLMDTFNTMDGATKGMLIIGGIAALAGFFGKAVKNMLKTGIGITAVAYVVRKFMFKDDDVGKTFSVWTEKGAQKLRSANQSMFGIGKGPMDGLGSDVMARANAIGAVLPTKDKQKMYSQTMCLGILSECPLNLLAMSYKMPGPRGWTLDMSTGLGKHLRNNGWKKDAIDHIEANMPMAAEGLAYTFYKVAAREPSNAMDRDAVEAAVEIMPDRKSPMDFPELVETTKMKATELEQLAQREAPGSPQRKALEAEALKFRKEVPIYIAADRAFVALVIKGNNMCRTSRTETLAEFYQGELGTKNAQNKETPREAQQKLLLDLQQKIRVLPTVQTMYAGQFDVTLDGSLVRYGNGIPVNALNHGATPYDVFSKADAQTIFNKYSVWVNKPNRAPTDTDPFK